MLKRVMVCEGTHKYTEGVYTLSSAALCLLLIVILAAMRVSVLQHHMHEVCSCIVLHELLALPYTDPICRAGSLSLK